MAAGTGHLTFHPELYHVVLTGDVLVSSMMLTFESATRRPRPDNHWLVWARKCWGG
ncbi:hypothetical protein ABBQ38_015438 [Trebouxia sp. C0009 RCD-2024]